MKDKKTTIEELKSEVAKFVRARDWEQFHSPKNLSMAIATEAAELMEHFRWESTGEDVSKLKRNRLEIEMEIADIFALLLSFSARYGIDLSSALRKKIKLNNKKYPVKKSKGVSKKYSEL